MIKGVSKTKNFLNLRKINANILNYEIYEKPDLFTTAIYSATFSRVGITAIGGNDAVQAEACTCNLSPNA